MAANYAFTAVSRSGNPAIPRFKAAAEAVFQIINKSKGSKGILVGGAAIIFMGSSRGTKDVDINVSKFPSFRGIDPDILYEREGSRKELRRLTFQRNDPKQSTKCDISISKAHIVRRFHSTHTVRIPGLEGVDVADPAFMLADKIHTYCDRAHSTIKCETDFQDIKFCIELMHAFEAKMDPALRCLYTEEDWRTVRNRLSEEFVSTAEKNLDVV